MMKNTVFKKIILLFSIIVLIYSTLLILLITNKAQSVTTLKNQTTNELYIKEASKNIDYKLSLLTSYIEQLNTNKLLTEYTNTASDMELTTRLFNKIQAKEIGGVGFYLGITKFKDNYVVATNGTQSYVRYLNSLSINNDQLKNLPKLFHELPGNFYFIPDNDNNSTVSVIIQSDKDDFKTPIYFIVTFDKKNLFPSYLPNNLGNFSLKYDTQEVLLSNSYSINKNKQVYSQRSSLLPLLSYNYYLNNSDFKKNNTIILSSIWLLIIPILLLGLLVIYIGSKKTYLPINTILKNMKHNTNGDKDSVNETAFIIQNIKSLNTINEELQEEFQTNFNTRKKIFFKDFLYGVPVNIARDFPEEYLSLEDFHSGGTVCLLCINDISSVEKNFSETNLFSLRTFLIESFTHSQQQNNFYSVPFDYKTFVLIFSHNDKETIQNILNSISKEVEKGFNISLNIAVADYVSTFGDLPVGFNQATKLLTEAGDSTTTKIITSTNIKKLNSKSYNYPFEIEENIIYAIKEKDYAKAKFILNNVLEANLNHNILKGNDLEQFKYSILNTFKRAVTLNQGSIPNFTNIYRKEILKLQTTSPKIIYQTFTKLFNQLFSVTEITNTSDTNSLAESIIKYLDDHFLEDISLTTVADHFKLSEGYISKLIKDYKNDTFKNYINNLKIQEAKELLKTNKYRVNEVSEMIGCNNVNTFIRMFKRYESISPKEFMKNNI